MKINYFSTQIQITKGMWVHFTTNIVVLSTASDHFSKIGTSKSDHF